jgi:hypothetical protein
MLIDIVISADRSVIKEEAEILTNERPYNRNTAHVERKKKKVMPVIINRDNWNHFTIIHKIPEQHIGKARNQGTAKTNHTGPCTHTFYES